MPTLELPHPSSHDDARLAARWRAAVEQLRGVVTPDDDGDPARATTASAFAEPDYAPIPPRDLPFGCRRGSATTRGAQARPQHNNSVERPGRDLLHTLVWQAPRDQP